MEKEIHRMRLRYESLLRTQEKLVKEMELAIDKRESISLRFHSKRVQEAESDSATPMTQIGLKKQIVTLKKALSAATVDTQGYEEAMEVWPAARAVPMPRSPWSALACFPSAR